MGKAFSFPDTSNNDHNLRLSTVNFSGTKFQKWESSERKILKSVLSSQKLYIQISKTSRKNDFNSKPLFGLYTEEGLCASLYILPFIYVSFTSLKLLKSAELQ